MSDEQASPDASESERLELDTSALEAQIGHTFVRRELLLEALIHPSYRHERPDLEIDNQALEYLGDAALDLAVASFQVVDGRRLTAGQLTQARSAVTNNRMFAEVAREINLGDYLQLGQGEQKSGGALRDGNLSDAFEALLGAVFLDAGFETVKEVVRHLFSERLGVFNDGGGINYENPKGTLQERFQQAGFDLPVYQTHKPMGPDHQRSFQVSVLAGEIQIGVGIGSRIQAAQQEAALHALRLIGDRDIDDFLNDPPSDIEGTESDRGFPPI